MKFTDIGLGSRGFDAGIGVCVLIALDHLRSWVSTEEMHTHRLMLNIDRAEEIRVGAGGSIDSHPRPE
jgi:hypothetical protein